jgi:hypothetical protein
VWYSQNSWAKTELRHQLCTERHETVVMGCIPRSSMCNSSILSEDIQMEPPRVVQKHDITDGVDLPLTTILEMFLETVESIGEEQNNCIANWLWTYKHLIANRLRPFTISSVNQLRCSSNEPNSSNINSSCICCLHTHLSLVQLS